MKISVIVPSFNSVKTIERTLESVWRQTHKDYEIIVMDGGSKDGTKEILERHNDKITYWQSAPDKGTTHAANDGFKKTTGDLVTILCSDDCFHNEHVFEKVIAEFKAHPETGVLCSTLRMVHPEGLIPPYLNPSSIKEMRRRGSLHLLGAFFRHSVFASRPMSYDVDVANDYDMFAYLITKSNVTLRVTDLVTVDFSLGGRTNNMSAEFWKIRECFLVRRKYFGFWTAWKWRTWDTFIAILRSMHFRPYTWGRKIKRLVKPSSRPANT